MDKVESNYTFEKYKTIGSLNLLKFAFVFLTFLFHWRVHFSIVYSNKLLDNFINAGAIAMSGFFILSGFLLYYIYSSKDFSDFNYLKNFYIKRVVKILPSAYIIVLIRYLLSVMVEHTGVDWTIIIMQIISLQAYFPTLFNEFLNGGLWFVSVLLFLYLFFPFFCFIIKSLKNDILMFIFVYLLGIFPSIVNCYFDYPGEYHIPYFRICEFLIGMEVAKFFKKKDSMKNSEIWAFLTCIAIFFSVGGLYNSNFFHHIRFLSNYMYYDVILLILIPLLIYFLSTAKSKYFLLVTQNKLSNYLGKIAYSFYLTQFICIYIMCNYVKPYKYFGLSGIEILVTSFIFSILLAIIFYELIEKRLTNFLLPKLIKK